MTQKHTNYVLATILTAILSLICLLCDGANFGPVQYDTTSLRLSPTNVMWANITNTDGSVVVTKLENGRVSLAATSGASGQPASLNLTNWSGITTGAFAGQFASQANINTSSNSLYGILETDLGGSSNVNWTFANQASNTVRALIPVTGTIAASNVNAFIPSLNGNGTNGTNFNLTIKDSGTNSPALLASTTTGNTNLVASITGTNPLTGFRMDAQGNVTNNGTMGVSGNEYIAGTLTVPTINPKSGGVLNLASSSEIIDLATGNVGINQSPATAAGSAILQVKGQTLLTNNSTVLNGLSLWNSGAGQPAFQVQSNGNVGIGTNNPQSALQWVGSATINPNADILITGTAGDATKTVRICSADGVSAGLEMGRNKVDFGPNYAGRDAFINSLGIGNVNISTNLTITGSLGIGTTTPAAKLDNQGQLRTLGLALSNINGTASTSLTTGATLSSNVTVYTFSSGGGSDMTLSLANNANYMDGTIWKIMLGTEGTNILHLTPTNFSAATADKIYRSTNIDMVPGTSLTIQKQGTNFNIVAGLPSTPIKSIIAFDRDLGGCTNYGSFFAPCNGQVLVDAGSPLNGVTLRNLNGNNQFLRGNTTSGGAGGAATHSHGFSGTTDVNNNATDGVSAGTSFATAADGHKHDFSGTTDATSSLPPYTDVTYLIRIK